MRNPRFFYLLAGFGLSVLTASPLFAQTTTKTTPKAIPTRTPVHFHIGGREVFFKTPPVNEGGFVYVPLEILKKIRVRGKLDASGNTLLLSPPTRAETVEIALIKVDGRKMIPLEELAKALDAVVQTSLPEQASDTPKTPSAPVKTAQPVPFISLLARVTEATYVGGSLHVTTTFPVPYRVQNIADATPQRGFIDCLGATLDNTVRVGFTKEDGDNVIRVRTGQNTPEIARVVLEVSPGYGLKPAESVSNSSVQIISGLISGVTVSSDNTASSGGKKIPVQVASSRTKPTKAPIKRGNAPDRKGAVRRSMPVSVTGMRLEAESDRRIKLFVATGGRVSPHLRYENGGTQLVVDLPFTLLNLANPENASLSLSHPLLQSVRIEQLDSSIPTTRLTLDLNRVVGFGVSANSGAFTLDLRLPKNAGGSLSDKVIVIDPGHGGSSTGALGGGYAEKNLTLAISLKLRTLLESCGAKVIMTRDNDTDVDLYARPRIANEIHADLFISVHNDSFTSNVRGTTTYYHKGDGNARALAQAVQREIVAVSGIPSKGALSDGVLYENGLAVLRKSLMPAILVEVAYISNATDRSHLTNPDFQQRIAAAIMRGTRAYVEGNPSRVPFETPTPAEESTPMESVESVEKE